MNKGLSLAEVNFTGLNVDWINNALSYPFSSYNKFHITWRHASVKRTQNAMLSINCHLRQGHGIDNSSKKATPRYDIVEMFNTIFSTSRFITSNITKQEGAQNMCEMIPLTDE